EIRQKYNLTKVIKMASNENPLGTPPLAIEALQKSASSSFRYPQGGNPRLVAALAQHHEVDPKNVVVGNGSDEIIDLLIRILADPEKDEVVCCDPCFSLYPIQAKIAGVKVKRCKLKADFSFDFQGLASLITAQTKIIFLTTPDNPTGYCPSRTEVLVFLQKLTSFPNCLVLIDEAYMDFSPTEDLDSLLKLRPWPDQVGIMRTFSKSYGLAGLRIGYAILPKDLAEAFFKARLPFSVNRLAEEAALAALKDVAFRKATLSTVTLGRSYLTNELEKLGCQVYPSSANFLMFKLPSDFKINDCYEELLRKGIIIRRLLSYNLPDYLRVSVGNEEENHLFIKAMQYFLKGLS
ncbi:MAG: histidinol-phosphate transaminase, partial [Desulfovibrionaceae bacterium]|nr:histidinol-phosphate transaminase [Desulfovibrionaceae bacterium]